MEKLNNIIIPLTALTGVAVICMLISFVSFYREKHVLAAIMAIPAAMLMLTVVFTIAGTLQEINLFATTFVVTLIGEIAILIFDKKTDERDPKKIYLIFCVAYHTSIMMLFLCLLLS